MNDKDFELLSQYLDGELDELSTRRIAQRLSAEPTLRATFARMTAVDERIRQAFAHRDDIPAHIAAMIDDAPIPPRGKLARFAERTVWAQAVAASLVAVAGLLLATLWQAPPAGPDLADVLEHRPSATDSWQELSDGRQLRPVLTFQDVDGAWCREYLVNDSGRGARGVACRDSGQWQVRIEVAADLPGSDSEFRPAEATDADPIADYTAGRAAGIALSAAEEADLIAGDWRD